MFANLRVCRLHGVEGDDVVARIVLSLPIPKCKLSDLIMYDPFGQRTPPPGEDRMFLVASAIPSCAPSGRMQAPIADAAASGVPSQLVRQTSHKVKQVLAIPEYQL